MEINFKRHNFIKDANTLSKFDTKNLKLEKGYLVNIDKNHMGEVVSPIVNTLEFPKCTCSWSAITNEIDTIEVFIQIRVGEVWSDFFTYGLWGLGKDNFYYNQECDCAKIDVDEVIAKNGKANAFRFKCELYNNAKLDLVCVSLKLDDYKTHVNCKYLPSILQYDVPKLNQNMVPVIGHEMCSATTSAMLLKFMGMDFSDKDSEFEHRYVAKLVADPGHNSPTYGNWVYNTAAMSSFGFTSYVARVYSWEELKYHLAKIGPVGLSIKGDTGLYKTGGHLLVVKGYKVLDGITYVTCNDPNINSRFGEGLFVEYDYPLETFMSFSRGVIYVIKK